jgi:tetratricopeptide (TPR) repeat protein
MFLNIILIIGVALSLAVILFIFVRKIPKLRMLDVETVPEEQAAKVRERIIVERMKRKTKRGKDLLSKGFSPVSSVIKNIFKNIFKKVHELESKHKREAMKNVPKGAEFDNRLKSIINEAEQLQKQEKFVEAEKKYIEVISLAPNNIDVYRSLAEVYLEMKEYKQAMETYFFVLKLVMKKSQPIEKEDSAGQKVQTISNAVEVADVHIDLGEVYERMENYRDAMKNYKKALSLEPNNPRNLDQMLNLSIEIKDKNISVDLLNRLEAVNPDNQKLKEYRDKIAEI